MKVRAEHVYPPIPIRDYDWSAVDDNYEPGAPHGAGPTRKAAVQDLCEQWQEKYDERFVPCDHCGTEGTIYSGTSWLDGDYTHAETCPACKGACVVEVEVVPVERDDDLEEREA
jgi:hypothetical protein